MYVIDPIKCFLIGGIAIAGGVVTHARKKSRMKSWVPTIGVVQNVRTASNGDSTVYVRFADQSGQPQTAGMMIADGDSLGLGSELEIYFNPQKPDQAFVRSQKDINLSLYIPLVGGALVMGLGVLSIVLLSGATE